MKYYEPELRKKIIKEVEETKSIKLVARKYDVPSGTISGWVKTGRFNKPNSVSSKNEKNILLEENQRLKKLVGEHALEISILKDLVKKTNQRKMINGKLPEIG